MEGDFNQTRKEGKSSNSGMLENALVLVLTGSLVASAVFLGIPTFSTAMEAVIGNRFANWLLANVSIFLEITKWLSIAGLGFLIAITFKQRSLSNLVKYPIISGLALVGVNLLAASGKDATLAALSLVNIAVAVLMWAAVNGVQTYVLIRYCQGTVPKNDENWDKLVVASIAAYILEIALNVVYNPMFAPLRDLVLGGKLIASIFNGMLMQNFFAFVIQIAVMLLSVASIEILIVWIFALKKLRVK